MSELMNSSRDTREFRWRLLTTVSALALIASAPAAMAGNDADHPIVWIELGGQLERADNSQTPFAPPFFNLATPDILAPMTDAQKLPPFSIGENGKITFEPLGSDWLLSASIRYGRSGAAKHLHHETEHPDVPYTIFGRVYGTPNFFKDRFGDSESDLKESHLVLDFQAGRDVGLGMLGSGSKSVLSVGVRFAQFTSSSHATLRARPVYGSGPLFGYPGYYQIHTAHFQSNTAVIRSRRDTRAVGPSLSWDASVPFAGNASDSELTFDWGVNAAILFGRQRARTHHQTAGYYFKGFLTYAMYKHTYTNPPVDRTRSRNVTIPNVGGFAGISFRYADAKISFGYRGDFFFNAMDTGWDTRKLSKIGFYGPYASLSFGLGD